MDPRVRLTLERFGDTLAGGMPKVTGGRVWAAVVLLASALAADAELAGKAIPRVAIVCATSCRPSGGGGDQGEVLGQFTASMRTLGHEDGKSVLIDTRGAGVSAGHVEYVISQLLRKNVDVIVAGGTLATVWAAKRATSRTPIVMVVAEDAAEGGLVASLAKPGGNITGISTPYTELVAKQLQLLRDAVPTMRTIGVLATEGNRSHDAAIRRLHGLKDREKVRVHVERAPVTNYDHVAVLSRLRDARVDGLLILPDPMLLRWGNVAMFGLQHRVPTISTFPEFPATAGLMAYGPSMPELFDLAARYVDRILKGVPPADLPVQQPTAFRLVINMTTAKALGLTIPSSLMLRADRVIE
jgi:putative ABC transport system substrate-binding protein